MPLLLTRAEVQPLLDLPEAIEVTESAFREQAEGQVAVHAPYHIGVKGDQALRVVSGALLRSRRVGVRLGPNVQLAGGDRMCALLFDAESGDLLSIMGYPFGTLRTAATIALAAKQLAREDAKKVGLFGIGRNALGLLKGIAFVRKLGTVVVSSRDEQRRRSFCANAACSLQVEVRPAERAEEAVRGMDIILTATNALTPVFRGEWMEPGVHVSSMGKPSELGRGVLLKADRIVVGSREHERNYFDPAAPRPLVELAREGRLSWENIHELGEVVAGRVTGRAGREEITVFKESQGGFGDVAFAARIYEAARKKGLGREVRL